MSETRSLFAKSDDGTSFPGRRASRDSSSASVGGRQLVIGGMMSETRSLFREE